MGSNSSSSIQSPSDEELDGKAETEWVVLKFGGTSVSSLERWEAIAKVLRQRISQGLRPLLVCSAVSQVSNQLEAALERALSGESPDGSMNALRQRHEDLAQELGVPLPAEAQSELDELQRRLRGISLTREASPRLRAEVLGCGELLSTRIGCAWLSSQGIPTRWLDARDLLTAEITEDGEHHQYLSATCRFGPDPGMTRELAASPETVLVTQGFLARGPDGDTALLGRGGSDTSATYLAAKLRARHVEIWTDVPGLFTADPRRVPDARRLRRLGYTEASELASRGAKVLHPRSLAPARKAGIPIHVRCSSDPSAEGTIIDSGFGLEEPSALAISSRRGMSVVSMDVEGTWQKVGIIAELSACFSRQGLSIDSISSSQTKVSVSLDPAAHPLDEATAEALLADLRRYCEPTLISPVASISVVGAGLRSVLHDMPSIFRELESRDVYLLSHAADDHSLTFVVDEESVDAIVAELHRDLMRARS